MKIVWCLAFLAVTLVEAKRTFISVPQEDIPQVLKASADCIAKHRVDADTLKKIVSWDVQDTDSFRKFLYCFAKTAGYADNQGHLIPETMSKLLVNHKKKDEFVNTINECNKQNGGDKYETMFKTSTCFYHNSPVLFKM